MRDASVIETKDERRARKQVHRAQKLSDRTRKSVLKGRKELRQRAELFLTTPIGVGVGIILCGICGAILGGTIAQAIGASTFGGVIGGALIGFGAGGAVFK